MAGGVIAGGITTCCITAGGITVCGTMAVGIMAGGIMVCGTMAGGIVPTTRQREDTDLNPRTHADGQIFIDARGCLPRILLLKHQRIPHVNGTARSARSDAWWGRLTIVLNRSRLSTAGIVSLGS